MIARLDQIEAKLEAQALQLPAALRARLAERLLASLDDDAEIDTAWRAEAERRVDEVEAGAADSIALDDILRELKHLD
jgi:putative addiction module component (TIGR02574 family)